MASLRITEFRGAAQGMAGPVPVPIWPALAHQAVTIGTEADSAAFNAATTLIRVQAEALCCIDIGTAPNATTAMCRLTAGMTEYYAVSPGHICSVITTT